MDLDGTLISVSSEKELLLSLLGRRRLARGAFLRFLAAYALHPGRTLALGKGWNRMYLRGMSPADLKRHCVELAERLRSRVRPEVARLVSSWSNGGTHVVLLSATLLPLARELAPLCGASRCVASRPKTIDGVLTGETDGVRPWGRAKADLARELIEELSVDPRDVAALGDSWSDRHILRLCGRPLAVSPSARLRRLALGEGWSIMEGRHARWA